MYKKYTRRYKPNANSRIRLRLRRKGRRTVKKGGKKL